MTPATAPRRRASSAQARTVAGASGFRVLLITPPLLPPNAPYPATPLLTAFLRRAGWDCRQADLSIELLSRIFSRAGLAELAAFARARAASASAAAGPAALEQNLSRYLACIEPAVAFLRGQRRTPPRGLPRGPRFRILEELRRAGSPYAAARDDRLRVSLFLDDVGDFVRAAADERFGFARYAEGLAAAAPFFEPLHRALDNPLSPLDRWVDELAADAARRHRPAVVGITIPFPGALYAALRIARGIRRTRPSMRIALGGGYVSTELRALRDPTLFEYADALVFDDGEIPLLRIVEATAAGRPLEGLPGVATRRRLPAMALRHPANTAARIRHRERPAPLYEGLPLDRYFGVAETPNPMIRLWSERFWNKLALAHGCYWRRCAFCDTTLDYIRRFDPADPDTVIRWMDEVHAQTGETGFHFVDEAAPPALLRRLSEKLAARGAPYVWWANVRLERAFDATLASRMARGGCIAVTGGLECANDRLLAKMRKGYGREEAAAACGALARAGIRVHLYLMYGFPTQTVAEAVEALDFVRRLFRRRIVASAYWHRFALTCHSPMYRAPAAFGIRPKPLAASFARNEVAYDRAGEPDWDRVGEGLRRATYNYGLGVGLATDVRSWFADAPAAVRS